MPVNTVMPVPEVRTIAHLKVLFHARQENISGRKHKKANSREDLIRRALLNKATRSRMGERIRESGGYEHIWGDTRRRSVAGGVETEKTKVNAVEVGRRATLMFQFCKHGVSGHIMEFLHDTH